MPPILAKKEITVVEPIRFEGVEPIRPLPFAFYLLPKIHKKNCPGRPVVSGCNTPTEKISAFVDHQLKPLVPRIPSYVKDTNDFLNKLKDIGNFPEGAILVTIDVIGLYPNIPHDEGLEAMRKILDTRINPEIPTDHIVDLVELVLKNNNFEFEGKHLFARTWNSHWYEDGAGLR